MAQLLKLTELHDGLVASATDNDGQFLLIEAAMDLLMHEFADAAEL